MQPVIENIEIDLSETRKAAELVRGLIEMLHAEHDLSRYEYTSRIRIAPGEIPHSHPVLTLNTMSRTKEAVLSAYLHEQMHWYVTWYSHAQTDSWRSIWATLKSRYPVVPIAFPEGAHTVASSYLHLIVNWLEIEALSLFLGQEAAIGHASKNFVYSGIYKIVISEWSWLAKLYSEHHLAPIRSASEMNAQDLELAAREDEACIDPY